MKNNDDKEFPISTLNILESFCDFIAHEKGDEVMLMKNHNDDELGKGFTLIPLKLIINKFKEGKKNA